MSKLFNDPQTYWNNKLAAYLHDPFDKAFYIQGHEERAEILLNALGVQKPNEEFWKTADHIASGFDRGQLPSYSADPNKNGAVDFSIDPVLTHPTGGDGVDEGATSLKIELPESLKGIDSKEKALRLSEETAEYMYKKLGKEPGDTGYSNKDIFRRNLGSQKGADLFAQARFLYTHLVLRFNLARDNVLGIGGLWHRLPADTRFPDHSIWQHNGLTSALYSAGELAGGEDSHGDLNVGLMVFSITPVQSFISKARKLRDFWTGSVLLSWLAFEGILWVVENLGPDHVVYPSLVDQPLMNRYLKKVWEIDEDLKDETDIASFPNKFVCVVPLNKLEDIKKGIEERVGEKWKDAVELSRDFLLGKADSQKIDPEYVKELFRRQTEGFWDIQFSAVKLIGDSDISELKKLYPEEVFKKNTVVKEYFQKMLKDAGKNYRFHSEGVFYELSHRTVQAALASTKMRREMRRAPEPGEKCSQCGEFEVLHGHAHKTGETSSDYKENIENFWAPLRGKKEFESDFSENERLCSICAMKRIFYRAVRTDSKGDHLLLDAFKDKESYPSTSYLAFHDYFERENIRDEEKKKEFAQKQFEKEDFDSGGASLIENRDRYYAILMMDGDRMGKLVNGETLASKWETILHPDIVKRLKSNDFYEAYRAGWEKVFKESEGKRFLSPAVHAAVSESLGDFALYGVKPIVKKYSGTLIYAGGDDVCAVLPVSGAIPAAREMADYYTSFFRHIDFENLEETSAASKPIKTSWKPEKGKLSINLGKGEQISISAGILICHHKESLKDMIAAAHKLLDTKAKKEGERNACAVELRKRSGGSRFFVRKFNDTEAWKAFQGIVDLLGKSNEEMARSISTSLLYKMKEFEPGFKALLKESAISESQERIKDLIEFQLLRSVPELKEKEDRKTITENIFRLIMNGNSFEPEALVVAAFFGKGGKKNE
jgi:CRISPR-associated protein Cmr2